MDSISLLGVYREKIFSPGKISDDAAILDRTLAELSGTRYKAFTRQAETLDNLSFRPFLVLSMAQSERALKVLDNWQKSGTRIINSVQSVHNCYRKPLIHLLKEAGIPIPPSQIVPLEGVEQNISLGSARGYWLKRADVHAIQSADVMRVGSGEELNRALRHFHRQKIEEVLVQKHVEGEVIKFYGVGRGEYFSAFMASSCEKISSRMKRLLKIAQQSAEVIGLEIYGGDAILTSEGRVVLIDLNDWPSFSRCCHAAAQGIARYIKRECEGDFHELSECC